MRARLAKAYPKITWTYAFDCKHFSHCFTAAFDLMKDTGVFNLNISDEMLARLSFEHELVPYIAQSLAHEIANYLLEGAVRWQWEKA